jgi:hypothetical protein
VKRQDPIELPFVFNSFERFRDKSYVPELPECKLGVNGSRILQLMIGKAKEASKDKKKNNYYPREALWFCYNCVRRGNMFFVCGQNWTQNATAHRVKRDTDPARPWDCLQPKDFVYIPWYGPRKIFFSTTDGTYKPTQLRVDYNMWSPELDEDWQQKVLKAAETYYRVEYKNEQTLHLKDSFRRFWAPKAVLEQIVDEDFLKRNKLELQRTAEPSVPKRKSIYLDSPKEK